MRISRLCVGLLVASCGAAPEAGDPIQLAAAEDHIDCAIGPQSDFSTSCAIERGAGAGITVRHRDGGFRRLTRAADGLFEAADGADASITKILNDGRTELSIGSDRYRLPAAL